MFENGYNGEVESCPVKYIWLQATTFWKNRENYITCEDNGFSQIEIAALEKFCTDLASDIFDDYIDKVIDGIKMNATSAHDNYIKKKLHVFLDDIDFMISEEEIFDTLEFMHQGHALLEIWQHHKSDIPMRNALQDLFCAWWDDNPVNHKYFDFDIREQKESLVEGLVQ